MKKIVLGLLVVWMAALTADLSAKSGPGTKKSGKCAVKNVIYMIGDGMGLSQVSMMMLENGYRPTAFDRSGNIALIKTYSANNRVTDSAAAGTALASGNKTDNGMLGMGPDGQIFKSIMERAKEEGYQTGLVVTVYLQHATPGAFFAHVPSRGDLDVISEQFVESGVDVALGGGKKFLQEGQKDGKPLIDALKTKDYRVVYDMNELNGVDRGKVVGLFADEYMPTVMKGRDENYLCNATKKALEILSNNAAGSKKGFMVMIEGSQIDSEGHANNAEGILAETRDFERAVGAAMDFADTHPGTLVVVTADHETSGLSITSNKTDFTLSESGIGYQFGTTGHTGTLVPVYLYGACADRINGIMDNTDLPKEIAALMRLK
nr:alkaline phosphatase [uncultured Alistipes sp.]